MLISKEVSVLWIMHNVIRRIAQNNSSNTGSNPVDINVVKESTFEILRVLFATRHHRIMAITLGQFEKLGFDSQWCQVAVRLLRKSEKVATAALPRSSSRPRIIVITAAYDKQ